MLGKQRPLLVVLQALDDVGHRHVRDEGLDAVMGLPDILKECNRVLITTDVRLNDARLGDASRAELGPNLALRRLCPTCASG